MLAIALLLIAVAELLSLQKKTPTKITAFSGTFLILAASVIAEYKPIFPLCYQARLYYALFNPKILMQGYANVRTSP